jgi:nitrogen fixation-related uncharacterized protein
MTLLICAFVVVVIGAIVLLWAMLNDDRGGFDDDWY